MKTIKYIFLFIVLSSVLLTPLLLSSCTSRTSYRDNVSCKELTEKAVFSLFQSKNTEYSAYTEDELSLFLNIPETVTNFSVIYSTDVNDIDEIGIFHCVDEKSAKSFSEHLSRYLANERSEQKAFIASYAPREIPKLENSSVKTYGKYVIYTVLNTEDEEKIRTMLENELKMTLTE